eukprot:GHVT01084059.1.p1 GENE.GHVT01084059.1~~GHVT01084059.1.p1  ORF type:complete len:808 (-),score=55.72 GHVT01084059.1:3895-6318(-)
MEIPGLYFVKRNLSRLVTGGRLLYDDIDRWVVDASSPTDVRIECIENRTITWKSPWIVVKSMYRPQLLRYLEVSWCTWFSCNTGRVPSVPQLLGPLREDPLANHLIAVMPFEKTQRLQLEDYYFFASNDLEARAIEAKSAESGTYFDPQGINVSIVIEPPIQVADLDTTWRTTVRNVGLAYKQTLTMNSRHHAVLRSQPYCKTMNLSSDIAAWTGWELFLRTPIDSTVCIILRRMYIPPSMCTAQDIVVTVVIKMTEQKENKVTDSELVAKARTIADSMSPMAQNPCWYQHIVQVKLNSLLTHTEHFAWFQHYLQITPSIFQKAENLLRSILYLLKREGVLVDEGILDELGEAGTVEDSPMALVNEMVMQGEGFDATNADLEEQKKANSYAMRVADYLAWCLEEGLVDRRFSLKDLYDAAACVGDAAKKEISELFAFFLHLRPKDMTIKWEAYDFAEQLKNLHQFETEFVLNTRVLERLLRIGYMEKLFGPGREDAYADLLGYLLRRSTSLSTKAQICRQVLDAIGHETARPSYKRLISSLVKILKLESADMTCSSVPKLALGALVNLSYQDDEVKAMLVELEITSVVQKQLRQKDEAMCEANLTLLVNLTKKHQLRKKVIDGGIVASIVDKLSEIYDSPFKDDQSKSLIMAVIGQLANDDTARRDFCYRYPTLEWVLYLFHISSPTSELRTRTVLCLKQLSQQDWHIQERVGKHTILRVISDFRVQTHPEHVSQAMCLLDVLASYTPNCFEMRAAGIQDTLQRLMDKLKLDVIFSQVAGLKEKISDRTRHNFYYVNDDTDIQTGAT